MVAKADPFAQLRLLELAQLDRDIATAEHRRRTLPEIAEIAAADRRIADQRTAVALTSAEIDDLDRAARKLDNEIDAVRARASRDSERLTSGAAAAKDLANLQHEITSLQRRQAVLEDEALELMERRESLAANLTDTQTSLTAEQETQRAAISRRDDAFADLDDQLGRSRSARQSLTDALPKDLIGLYERIRASGKIAAAPLNGSRCEACRMDLDRSALSAIHAASVDAVVRCDECGAILIRS